MLLLLQRNISCCHYSLSVMCWCSVQEDREVFIFGWWCDLLILFKSLITKNGKSNLAVAEKCFIFDCNLLSVCFL